MSKELDELMRRCQAAGLNFVDEGNEVIVYFPGTAGVYIPVRDAGWVLEMDDPFEEYEELEGFVATWSSSQQMIESNLIDLNPEVRVNVALGRLEHLRSYDEDLEQMRHRVEGKDPLSKTDKRRRRVQEILLRLAHAQNKPEYFEAHTNPRQRILIDSNTNLSISIGLSSDAHALVQEEVWEGPETERSLTLQIRGAKAGTQEEAAESLVRIADSVLFAVDEATELPLALERDLKSRKTKYSRQESFPVNAVDSEYDRAAMSLYWSAKAASSMPLIQFLAYYQVLEFYFQRYTQQETWNAMRKVLKHPRFDPRRDDDIGRLFRAANVNPNPRDKKPGRGQLARLTAVIRECVSTAELRSFIADKKARYEFYKCTQPEMLVRKDRLSGDSFSDPLSKAAKRISDIRNRIVHAEEGQEPLLPSDPEVEDLKYDIELVEYLARRVLRASGQPLQL